MMPLRPILTTMATCCAALVVAVGCSNSTNGNGSAPTITGKQLQAIPVRAADLPSGWKASAYKADPGDVKAQQAFTACVGGKDTAPDKVAEKHAPDYNSGNASISSQASSFRSSSDVKADIATLGNGKAGPCYVKVIDSQIGPTLPAGTKVDKVTFTVKPGSNGGPSNLVAMGHGTLRITVHGDTVTAYIDVAFISGPAIEAQVDFENVNLPVESDVQTAVIAAVAHRAAHP
jgi:hypothetical protein